MKLIEDAIAIANEARAQGHAEAAKEHARMVRDYSTRNQGNIPAAVRIDLECLAQAIEEGAK